MPATLTRTLALLLALAALAPGCTEDRRGSAGAGSSDDDSYCPAGTPYCGVLHVAGAGEGDCTWWDIRLDPCDGEADAVGACQSGDKTVQCKTIETCREECAHERDRMKWMQSHGYCPFEAYAAIACDCCP